MKMIHPTAQVHPKAILDETVRVGPFCVIGSHVRIGPYSQLLSHVVIQGNTEIGTHNQFFPFSVIGEVPQDLKYKGEPTRLVIGNHNTIRESVTIHLGTVPGGGLTEIGNHNLIMAYSHVGHDVHIGHHCVLSNTAGLAGHVLVEDYVTLAGMVGVSQFTRLGTYCYVSGMSGIIKDVPPFSIASGITNHCTLRGANIVGMRRKQFSSSVIQIINEAIQLWVRSEVPKEQCLLEIDSQYGDLPEIQQFLNFIRNSKSGVIK